MIRRNLNNWIGRAAMACALLVPTLFAPGLAHAATPCTSLASNFYTYPVPVNGMPISYSAFYLTAAPAGCSWALTHNQYVTLAAERGTGSGWVYFGVPANNGSAARTGTIGSGAVQVCGGGAGGGVDPIGNRSSGSSGACYLYPGPSFSITLPQPGR